MTRPAKSAEIHRLQGTRKHASTVDPEDDSRAFTGGRLKMPPEYKTDPHKVAVWRKLFGALHRRRTLTRADSAVAELLVEDWIMWEGVNAEAQARPFSEVTWRDSAGNDHSKTVESAASKMAASLQRSITQKLKEFSATPASRAKTKKTSTPKTKNEPYKEGSVGDVMQEYLAMKQGEATAPEEELSEVHDEVD